MRIEFRQQFGNSIVFPQENSLRGDHVGSDVDSVVACMTLKCVIPHVK
jgi:hypothetical protein